MAEHSYQLYMRRGPMPGELFVLTAPTLIIGRDPLADILIRDPEVSRNHARLVRGAQGYEIQDMGSTNGTFIEGKPLRGNPYALRPGDAVALGSNVVLEYQQMEMSTDDPLATMIAPEGVAGDVDGESGMTPDRSQSGVTGRLGDPDEPVRPPAFAFLDDDDVFPEGAYQEGRAYQQPAQPSFEREALPQTGRLDPSGSEHAFPPPHGGSGSHQPSPEPEKKGNTLLTILLIVLILLVALCCFFAVLTLYFLQDAGLIGWGTQVLSTAV